MCGIFGYWAKESLPDKFLIHALFEGAENRGRDGVGYAIYRPSKHTVVKHEVYPMSYEELMIELGDDFINSILDSMLLGDLLLGICRATPETEPESVDVDTLQPILNKDQKLLLIHNGGVTEACTELLMKEAKYEWKTKIDSETILAGYVGRGRNLNRAMEEDLSGSFAFLLVDMAKNFVYITTSFNPLAHAYLKGHGYIVHSDLSVLKNVIRAFTGASRDGMAVWESWYAHEIKGYTIIEMDLESGFQMSQTYDPLFIHSTWDPFNFSGDTKCYVVASGGIDSGLTGWILKLAGLDVEYIHFSYGQKSEDIERYCIKSLGHKLGIPVTVADLSNLYKYVIRDQGMLTNPNIDVTTGGSMLKSTIAWVAGRNALFASIVMAKAEALILANETYEVIISAGWSQLSEETGGYPDNSDRFVRALQEVTEYGFIAGSRMIFLPVLRNLTKTECWVLGKALKFPFELTVSCDEPQMDEKGPVLCNACGSTKLSRIAAVRAGVEDPRRFYGPDTYMQSVQKMHVSRVGALVDKLMLGEVGMKILKTSMGRLQ